MYHEPHNQFAMISSIFYIQTIQAGITNQHYIKSKEYIGHSKNIKGLQGTTITEKMTRLRTAIDYPAEEDDNTKVNAKVEISRQL